ncbi:hypothetical protein [Gynuella sunshinyii]|uniref:Uncharacterized protein n=1 Tax=Gynuella sunshinyii YC6258 TaxID=1445510 RepID=A0A0C5VDC7_9GAMM|nr:hypothetical protein [Gynuella sunshinyii]AJQ92547.1 hypothetical Protein YC6258_00497 [Gynuella sunshinyii YC6258]
MFQKKIKKDKNDIQCADAALGVQNQYYSPYGTTSVVPNGYMYIRAQEELAEQGTIVVVVDNAQKSFGIGDQVGEVATAGMIVAGFFLGVGPSELVFGPDSIQSHNLSLTPEFQRVRDLFFKTYGSQLSASNDWSGIHATNFGKTISIAEGFKIAWQSPTGAYVGSFTVTDIVGGPNRTLMYALDNNTSLSSLTGRIFGEISYDRTGYTMSPMSTVSQTYFITEQY